MCNSPSSPVTTPLEMSVVAQVRGSSFAAQCTEYIRIQTEFSFKLYLVTIQPYSGPVPSTTSGPPASSSVMSDASRVYKVMRSDAGAVDR